MVGCVTWKGKKLLRPTIYLGALFAGLAILAACAAGGGRDSPNQPSTATSVIASCQPIEEIQSYRYTISLQLESPALLAAAGCVGPVGLMVSTITTKGWSKPITTAALAEDTRVRVMEVFP